MRTPLYMMWVVAVLLVCPLLAADPNAAGESPQSFAQWMLPGLLDCLAAAGALVGLLGAWALRRLTADMKDRALRDEVYTLLDAGVEQTWETYVRDLKQAAADHKLTKAERQEARQRALASAARIARDPKVAQLLWGLGEQRIAAIIRSIVQARKAAAAVILAALLITGAGCISRPVHLRPALAAEVSAAEIDARVALVNTDANQVADALKDSTAVLLRVYDPNEAALSAQARMALAEVIAIAEQDYRDCRSGTDPPAILDADGCRERLIETHWWLRWLLYTDAETEMP